jgi:CRISPR-associated protein Cmr1
MIRLKHTFEIITPCFCGGAQPEKEAEIRPASIRGQLRWWFRVLGGFKSLAPGMSLREQEHYLFGSAAGEEGAAGRIALRVHAIDLKGGVYDGQELGHPNFSPSGFLTFPIQSREQGGRKTTYAGRGAVLSGKFLLELIWRGEKDLKGSLEGLLGIFGNLGSLGFRSRRAMGALRIENPAAPLEKCFEAFSSPQSIVVKALPCSSAAHGISQLGGWLKRCRAHGRSGQNTPEMQSPYFQFAKRDHDIGYGISGAADAFRPALGLPIIQRTASGTNHWEWEYDAQRHKPFGRFASPVILRPHKDANGKWHALVIFVDAKQWPAGKEVFFNGLPRSVSLDLYEAMKADRALVSFL